MQVVRTLFFGSALESLHTLEVLRNWKSHEYSTELVGVVTQPARPVGRKKEVTPTAVELWGRKNTIPVLTFQSSDTVPWLYKNEQTVIDTLAPLKPDLVVVTYFGQKIPLAVIQGCKFGGLNIHPSLLPRWRGADPVPWAILWGDHQVGITIVTLAENFDEGTIIAQKKFPLGPTDKAETLYPKLFDEGARLFSGVLHDYLDGNLKDQPQGPPAGEAGSSSTPYARRLTRADGYIPWSFLSPLIDGNNLSTTELPPLFAFIQSDSSILNTKYSILVDRMYRALHPWPGIWTTIPIRGAEKRLKILELELKNGKIEILRVQLEGKIPLSFSDFGKAYLTS